MHINMEYPKEFLRNIKLLKVAFKIMLYYILEYIGFLHFKILHAYYTIFR